MGMIKESQDGFGNILTSMCLCEVVKTNESSLQKDIIVCIPYSV